MWSPSPPISAIRRCRSSASLILPIAFEPVLRSGLEVLDLAEQLAAALVERHDPLDRGVDVLLEAELPDAGGVFANDS